MEPGHEDREDPSPEGFAAAYEFLPQWSPAMKTGKTSNAAGDQHFYDLPQWSPAMKTGKTARKNSAG